MRCLLPLALTVACAACGFDDWAAGRFDDPADVAAALDAGAPTPPPIDAEPAPDARPARRDAAPPGGPMDVDARPPPRDAAPPPPPPPPGPPRIQLTVAAAPEAGCGERTLSLTWTTQGATRCAFGAPPEVDLRDVPAADVARGGAVLVLHGDATVELSCQGPAGRTSERSPVVFAPALPPERMLSRADASLRGAQQRCAAATGAPAMGNDDEVRDDAESAARLCTCLGYAMSAVVDKDDSCFSTPHDNGIWWWVAASMTWQSDRASRHNRCLTVVRCTQPVADCAELLVVD
ncbi:MAG: hypothetical protein H6704_02845 [Myxococcales bacterium]|nr:hypothetical protein [Myxococcales bacterium]